MSPGSPTSGPLAALETSGPVGSVAVGVDGRVVARAFLADPRSHARGVLAALDGALASVGLAPPDLTGVLVGSGPGSFTGVRVAAATAKGLAHALGVPLWAFSSLAAASISDLALPRGAGPAGWWSGPTAPPAGARWVLFDARGGRVYAALYGVAEEAAEEIQAPRATVVDDVLAGPLPPGVAFVGDGALRHRERIERAGLPVLHPPAGVATADGLVFLMALRPDAPPLPDPGGWEPDYLRASNAERERET